MLAMGKQFMLHIVKLCKSPVSDRRKKITLRKKQKIHFHMFVAVVITNVELL